MQPVYNSSAFIGAPSPSSIPERLPGRILCVLARNDPARLLLDLASVRHEMRALATVLGRGTTYHVSRQLDAAREQAHDLAHRIDRARRQVHTGRCGRLRRHEQYRGYISVRDRELLGDGGLRTASRVLDDLADAMKRLHGREPWSVRVRDSSLASTQDRITAITGELAGALDEIAVDVTAANLSHCRDLSPAVLQNAMWSLRTIWPPALAGVARAQSRPLCRDVFQVAAE
jgi:hypothetical protein